MIRQLLTWMLCAAAGMLHAASFDFYGVYVQIPATEKINAVNFPAKVNSNNLNLFVNKLQNAQADDAFRSLKFQADKMQLDDLGYFQLLKYYSYREFPSQTADFRKVLVWYGLRFNKNAAILAGSANYINLFVNLDNPTDGGFYMTRNSARYYSVTTDPMNHAGLQVFEPLRFEDSMAYTLSMNTDLQPKLGREIKERERDFTYGSRQYYLQTKYNAQLVQYLNDLPSFRVGTYLYNLKPSEEAQQSMNDSLVVWLKGKSYSERMAFLLNLVQTAFPYKADRDYRKREKRNFVEQTLADDFTDCEDKAAFFCYLAEKYLNAETAMLYSSSAAHVTAAIALPLEAPGYNFKNNGTPFIICEASFAGYKPGQTDLSKDEILHAEIYR